MCQLLALSQCESSTARRDPRVSVEGGVDQPAIYSVENVRIRQLHQNEDIGYANVPRWSEAPMRQRGPVEPSSLNNELGPGAGCLTIGEILEKIPDVSKFSQLLTYSGLKKQLLDDPKVMTTLVVPRDEAFSVPLAEPNEYGANMSALIQNRPDVINSLIGAAVWKGLYPSSSLQSGMRIPTSNSIGGMGAPPLEVEIDRNRDDISIQAQGSTSTIIVKDIAACGPSVIHIVDTILLPFSFDDQPKDRLNPQNSVVQAGIDAQNKIAEDQVSNVDFNWREFFG